MDFHAMLTRLMAGTPMTREEVDAVLTVIWGLTEGHETERLLYDHIQKEFTTGERCSVCGRYSDEQCILNC